MKFNKFYFLTLAALILLSLTPLIWFLGKGHVLIDGVDTNFPLNPTIWFGRRFFVWSNVFNGGSDASSSVAGLFFHFLQFVPYNLQLGLQVTEIFSLIAWFALIIFSGYFFARSILPGKSLVQVLFSVLYGFNTYLFNTWENVKVSNLALVVGIPLVLAVFTNLIEHKISRKKAFFYFVMVGIVASGSGINPAYFATIFIALGIYFLSIIIIRRSQNLKKYLFDFLLAVVALVLINSFWLVPTANYIFINVPAGNSIDKIGFTNWVDSLSENTSILNILRIQGAWDWYAFDSVSGQPLYIPYAVNYFSNLPFLIFSFLLPALVLLSFIFLDKKKIYLYLSFGVMILFGVFLGVGTHLPTGVVYRFLANHLPFFSLFRSPWYIFTPLVTLSYAGLISLLLVRLEDLKINFKVINYQLKVRYLVIFLAAGLIVTNLVYNYPLVTGKIFRPDRQDGFFVKFPPYVFTAQNWLLNSKGDERIAAYPDDELERFDWGYVGIESILDLLANRETLSSALNIPDSALPTIVKQFYHGLKKDQIVAANRLAEKLNIGLIFEKNDQSSLSPPLPPEVKQNTPEVFGLWSFYPFPEKKLGKIYSVNDIYVGEMNGKGQDKLAVLDGGSILLNRLDKSVNLISGISNVAAIVEADNSQSGDYQDFTNSASVLSKRLLSRNLSAVNYSFNLISAGEFMPVLDRYKLEDFGIDPNKVEVLIDGKKVILQADRIDDSFVYFKNIDLNEGQHTLILNLINKNLVNNGNFESNGFEQEGEGEYTTLSDDGKNHYLSILNKNKRDISANFSINNFNPYQHYLVQFRYRQIYGNNATALAMQANKNSLLKTQVERLPDYPEWNNFSFYYQPVESSSSSKIALVSPATKDPLGTKVLYDDLAVYKIFENNLFFINKQKENNFSKTQINYEKVNSTLYKGSSSGEGGNQLIVFSENYSPQWELIAYDDQGNKLNINPIHFSANLYANAWYINNAPGNYKFQIYYKPQTLLKIGLFICIATLMSAFVFMILSVRIYVKNK